MKCADHRDMGASKGTRPEQITMQFTLSILIPCKIFSVTQFILNPITSLRYLRLNKPKDWILEKKCLKSKT